VPMKLAIATLRIDVSLDADVFKSIKSPDQVRWYTDLTDRYGF